ncbi:hypothetical protein QUF80_04975 [Desulfococcaceae bacterium HSG8]|nr:hypothetical protein [Desulfococcaceae bacterium HSG8]
MNIIVRCPLSVVRCPLSTDFRCFGKFQINHKAQYSNAKNASRITHHVSRFTFHVSRITFHSSP